MRLPRIMLIAFIIGTCGRLTLPAPTEEIYDLSRYEKYKILFESEEDWKSWAEDDMLELHELEDMWYEDNVAKTGDTH